MSLITLIIGIGIGWFVANLVTYHQLTEMSCEEVEQLKERIDWLEHAHEERHL